MDYMVTITDSEGKTVAVWVFQNRYMAQDIIDKVRMRKDYKIESLEV